jgi:hypothetical protein
MVVRIRPTLLVCCVVCILVGLCMKYWEHIKRCQVHLEDHRYKYDVNGV